MNSPYTYYFFTVTLNNALQLINTWVIKIAYGGDIVYCEMCGRPIQRRQAVKISLEGAVLLVCPSCANRVRSRRQQEVSPSSLKPSAKKPSPTVTRPTIQRAKRKPALSPKLLETYEVVPDFAERIRRARNRLGWSTKILAEKVGEPESVIKRIEDGRLTPTIDMALRLEKVLRIKLLQPIVEDYEDLSKYLGKPSSELTLGDIVNIRVREKKQ
ncbi:MAG TPA: TIGR00270 family protein [Desulfurococcaceae archaeon]|nr:TIGR00270 family protein [Desulfurococcaceae archaeon]